MLLDLSQKGLRVAFPEDWQVEVMMEVWRKGQITSAQAHDLTVVFGPKVGRTSVIYFLNRMVKEGLLTSDPVKEDGHLQFLYKINPLVVMQDAVVGYPFPSSPEGFKEYLVKALQMALREVPVSG